LRHNLPYIPSHHHLCSFALGTAYFPNQADQTKKVFDSEKCSPSRDNHEWILWSNVRPIKRYGRSAPFRVEKENTALTGQSPYVIYFKLDIPVWMKRVNDPEGFIVKVLVGCS
jgi:hypothetical protein